MTAPISPTLASPSSAAARACSGDHKSSALGSRPRRARPLGSQTIQGGHLLLQRGLAERRRDGGRCDERRDGCQPRRQRWRRRKVRQRDRTRVALACSRACPPACGVSRHLKPARTVPRLLCSQRASARRAARQRRAARGSGGTATAAAEPWRQRRSRGSAAEPRQQRRSRGSGAARRANARAARWQRRGRDGIRSGGAAAWQRQRRSQRGESSAMARQGAAELRAHGYGGFRRSRPRPARNHGDAYA